MCLFESIELKENRFMSVKLALPQLKTSKLAQAVKAGALGLLLGASLVSSGAYAQNENLPLNYPERIDSAYMEDIKNFMVDYTSLDQIKAFNEANPEALKFSGDIQPKLITVKSEKDGFEVEVALYEPQYCESNSAKCPVFKEGERRGIKRMDRPLILFSYAGGFLFRSAYYEAEHFQLIANTTQSLVAVPRYRLSIEKPFPAALEDSYSALDYLYNHAADYKIDQDRIFLWGESAGGNLSAALALYNRDHYDFPIAAQIMFAPMLDYRTGTKHSPYKSKVAGEVSWTAKSNVFAWQQLGDVAKIEQMGADPRLKMISKVDYLGYFSPTMAKDKSNLPPAYIYVGDIDLFAQESVSYANDLLDANVPVELTVAEGLYHWFDRANPQAARTQEYYRSLFGYFNRHLNY